MLGGVGVAVLLLAGPLDRSRLAAVRRREGAEPRPTSVRASSPSRRCVDTSFAGQIQTLSSIAKAAPSVVGQQLPPDGAVLPPGQPARGCPVHGRDRLDRPRRASSGRAEPTRGAGTSGSSREPRLFPAVVATHRPYVSAGLIGEAVHQPVIVVAVPTFGPGGPVHRCPRREHAPARRCARAGRRSTARLRQTSSWSTGTAGCSSAASGT